VSVETYLKGMHHTLSHLTAQVIAPLDFSDDRLSHLLAHLSQPTYWHQIERDLKARSIEVYALSQDVIRCDATTVSGAHEVTTGGLVQFGHSKDDPTRPQIKVMMGSLDPLGMPLATDVLSGERADDGLYLLSAPLTIPLVCCHINSFRRASSGDEAMARRRKEDRRAGLASRGI
jgi:transposase